MGNVVVVGNFDGVHAGHQQLLEFARERHPDGELIAVTFWPHPMSVIRPDLQPKLLTSLGERVALLKAHGADRVEVVRFDEELAHQSPEEFVERTLIPLDPDLVVVGTNFRFGHRAAGDVAALRALGHGRFSVDPVALIQAARGVASSTAVRQALDHGDVDTAAEYLRRPFRFDGTVVEGDRRGRELGFPTANLPVPDDYAVPADGVYAGWVTRLDQPDAERWPAAISVGTNPTFDGAQRRVEAYVLDRDDLELYGVPIAVDFVHRLRGMVKFDGVDGLIAQMKEDCRQAARVLAGQR